MAYPLMGKTQMSKGARRAMASGRRIARPTGQDARFPTRCSRNDGQTWPDGRRPVQDVCGNRPPHCLALVHLGDPPPVGQAHSDGRQLVGDTTNRRYVPPMEPSGQRAVLTVTGLRDAGQSLGIWLPPFPGRAPRGTMPSAGYRRQAPANDVNPSSGPFRHPARLLFWTEITNPIMAAGGSAHLQA